jgi:hypothetical protein
MFYTQYVRGKNSAIKRYISQHFWAQKLTKNVGQNIDKFHLSNSHIILMPIQNV